MTSIICKVQVHRQPRRAVANAISFPKTKQNIVTKLIHYPSCIIQNSLIRSKKTIRKKMSDYVFLIRLKIIEFKNKVVVYANKM